MSTIKNIYQFIDYKGISVNEFSKNTLVSNGYFAKQRGTEGAISSKILEKIVKKYPEINPDWLITGDGSMLRENNRVSIDNDPESVNALSRCEDRLAACRSEVERLHELLTEEQAQVGRLIALLEGRPK